MHRFALNESFDCLPSSISKMASSMKKEKAITKKNRKISCFMKKEKKKRRKERIENIEKFMFLVACRSYILSYVIQPSNPVPLDSLSFFSSPVLQLYQNI